MPIFIEYPIKVYDLAKGRIIINGTVFKRQIWFGLGVAGLSNKSTCLEIQQGATLEFNGRAHIARGCVLRVDSGAILKLGNNVGINCNSFIRCSALIRLGNDVLMGWENEISDNDGHEVWMGNNSPILCKPVEIGNHVWITSHIRIGKGVKIADDCVVAKGAIVTYSQPNPRSLIGGIPAKEIRRDIDWKK